MTDVVAIPAVIGMWALVGAATWWVDRRQRAAAMYAHEQEYLDDLTDLWHDGLWEDLELEDVIREATGWGHETFDRWAATGALPGQYIPNDRESWCGHV